MTMWCSRTGMLTVCLAHGTAVPRGRLSGHRGRHDRNSADRHGSAGLAGLLSPRASVPSRDQGLAVALSDGPGVARGDYRDAGEIVSAGGLGLATRVHAVPFHRPVSVLRP